MTRKLISIMTPCYNEEENVEKLYEAVKAEFEKLPEYDYEHIFIDNCSADRTVEILEGICAKDPNIKLIANSRNFGHIRSPFHGLMQTSGDASILMSADFQDPPSCLPEFIKRWAAGKEIVIGVKNKSQESALMFFVRRCYYFILDNLSETKLIKNYMGFGIYDRKIMEALREFKEPYPYLRGMVLELGYDPEIVHYTQPARKRGFSKNNFLVLYDIAMLGICSYSKLPLRLATFLGFFLSITSFITAMAYIIAKLLYWDKFDMGIAPIMIGVFFFASVQLFMIGILGEYIGWIFTKVSNRPLVHEKKRVNF